MNFNLKTSSLSKALYVAKKVVPFRSTLPILDCVLLEMHNNTLSLKATDLEQFVEINIHAEFNGSLETALPFNKLFDIITAIKEETINLNVKESGGLEISTQNGKYTLMGQNPENFPQAPSIEETRKLDISLEDFEGITKNASFAVSRDELKPALSGILFSFYNKEFICVATDGHKLVKIKNKTNENDNQIIIPIKFFNIIESYTSDTKRKTETLISKNHLSFKTDNTIITTRLISEQYPDYESVIPKDNNKRLIVKTEDLLGAVKRTSVLSNKTTKQITLKTQEDRIVVSTEDQESISSGSETIQCEYNEEEIVIAFNSNYLKEVLSHIKTDKVTILLKNSLSASIFLPGKDLNITNSSKTTLLMPIRINTHDV
tara:strand:- start:3717 stop:4841 length:1125 start_codon:yes stop_codon:yes gene_type:complete